MARHNDQSYKQERKEREIARRAMRQRPRGKAWEAQQCHG